MSVSVRHQRPIVSSGWPHQITKVFAMKLLFGVLSFCILFQALEGAQVNVCVKFREGGKETRLDANVKCWDEDSANPDDAMTSTVRTGSDGCVSLSYSKKDPKWYNPCNGWDCAPWDDPDIYCKISKSGYYLTAYTDTKEDHNQNSVANFGTVKVYPDRVARGDPGSVNGCGPQSKWDGISDVANFLTGFEDVCNNHDLCYNSCRETQASCDLEFRDLLYSCCNDYHDTVTLKKACKKVADGMVALVRKFGDEPYASGQRAFGCR